MIPRSYQEEVLESGAKRRILIGARQIGKTETVVEDAVQAGPQAVIFTASQRHAKLVRDKIRERGYDMEGSLNDPVIVAPARDIDRVKQELDGIVNLYIDEASMLDQDAVFQIIEWDATEVNQWLLATTPRPVPGIVELNARYSRRWQTTHVAAESVEALHPDVTEEWDKSMEEKQAEIMKGSLEHIE